MVTAIHLKSGRTARILVDPLAIRTLFKRVEPGRVFSQPNLVIYGRDCTVSFNSDCVEFILFPAEAELNVKVSPHLLLIPEASYVEHRKELKQTLPPAASGSADPTLGQAVAEIQMCSAAKLYMTFSKVAATKTDRAVLIANLFTPRNSLFIQREVGGHILLNNTLMESVAVFPSPEIDLRTAWTGDLLPAATGA